MNTNIHDALKETLDGNHVAHAENEVTIWYGNSHDSLRRASRIFCCATFERLVPRMHRPMQQNGASTRRCSANTQMARQSPPPPSAFVLRR